MRVLVACEFSGKVRDAFIRKGHDAISCDLIQSETDGPHYLGDVRDILKENWDLIIAFPPCTHLARSGARWWKNRREEQQQALDFVRELMNAPCEKICIENPIGAISTNIRKPDQVIHPWQFGHGETKTTCLWLKNLKHLTPTNIVSGREHRIHNMPGTKHRTRLRSITYDGIANAMAEQWG